MTLRRYPSTCVVVVAAVAWFAASGCSTSERTGVLTVSSTLGGAGEEALPTAVGVDNAASGGQSNAFDLYSYLGPVERQVIYQIDLQVADCMRAQGFEWTPSPPGSQAAFESSVELSSKPPTMADIEQYGYAWKIGRLQALDATTGDSDDVVDDELMEPKEACTRQVMTGSPYESWLRMSDAVYDQQAFAMDRVMATPDYREAVDLWVTCMSKNGYQVDEPDGSYLPDSNDDRAKALAIVDYQCRFDVGLFDTQARLMNQESQRWVDENPGVVDQMDQLREQLAAFAASGQG